MGMSMRVSLPGHNCLTDTNPDHYALYADQDWILIKENARGSVTLGAGGTHTVTHNLGYIPFFLVYGSANFSIGTQNVNGWFSLSPGVISVPQYFAICSTQQLFLQNNSGGNVTYKYFIFYDQQA